MTDPSGLGDQLWAVVEAHPSNLTPDGEKLVRQLIDAAAPRLAEQPDRMDEAVENLQQLLNRAEEHAVRDEYPEADGGLALEAAITSTSIEAGLRDLCPIFPIC